MNNARDARTQSQILAAIEQEVKHNGYPGEAPEPQIAERLGVPHDAYIAYLLVWGAVESYRLTHPDVGWPDGSRQHRDDTAVADRAGEPVETVTADLFEVARALSTLWEHAGSIHEAAINDAPVPVVREQARRLVGCLLTLSELLLDGQPTAMTAEAGRE